MIKLGINGFGRVGKMITRMAAQRRGVQVVIINEPLIDTEYLAYLMKYDSVYGVFAGQIKEESGVLTVGNNPIRVYDKVCPSEVPWEECDFVIEASGEFTDAQRCGLHIKGGAKKVIVTAPSGDIPMFAMGLNHEKYNGEKIMSYSSPEANALGLLAKAVNDNFGIENGIVTCINALSAEGKTVDRKSPKSWRSGRAAGDSVIPAVCGAAQAVGNLIPELSGVLSGIALRVPVRAVSMVNLCCKLEKATDYTEVKNALKQAAEGKYKGLLGVTEESVVSSDFIGCQVTAVADIRAGLLQGGNLLKLSAWYDGEWSYVAKLLDFAEYVKSN